MREADEKQDKELEEFVDRIAQIFSHNELSSAELVVDNHDCHLSGYKLHRSHSADITKKTEATKKERKYVRVLIDQSDEVMKSHLVSAAIGIHRFSLKQDLHFDAFRKLLYEKGLVVREVVDWRIQRTKNGEAKIREWGKNFSALKRNDNKFKRVCIITKKSSGTSS